MGFGDSWLIRPGTVFLMLLIGAFGLGMYSWASDNFEDTGRDSLEQGRAAVECSTLEVELVEFDTNETHTRVFFKSNRDMETAYVHFRGGENITRTVDSISEGSIRHVAAPSTGFRSVSLEVEGCDRVFQ